MIIRADDRPVSWTMDDSSPSVRLEPITLAWTKKAIKFGSTSEDALLPVYISMARTHFEEQTGRQILDAVWEYALDGVPDDCVIELPRPPLVGDVTVAYDDANGAEQTFDSANYRVFPSVLAEGSPAVVSAIDPYCGCGRIELVSGATWPTTSGQSRCLRIRRTCGYAATVDEVPELIRGTLAILVGHFFRNRQEVGATEMYKLPYGAETMISAFKYSALLTRPPRDSETAYSY